MTDRLLTADEVADRLSVAKSTIYAWIHQGRLQHVKLGRAVRFIPACVERLIQESIQEAQEVEIDVRP